MGVSVTSYRMYLYKGAFYWSRSELERRENLSSRRLYQLALNGAIKTAEIGSIPPKVLFNAGYPYAYYYKETGEYFRCAKEFLTKYKKNRQWIFNHDDRLEKPEPKTEAESLELLREYFYQ